MIKLRMRYNLGCGPGPVLATDYVYVDSSRKLLLKKTPILNLLTTKITRIENSWDKKVKFKNILKLHLESNSVESLYSSHLLEHLYYDQCVDLLQRIHRSLKQDGIIRLALPDYDAFIKRYIDDCKHDPVAAIKEFEESLLSHPLKKPSFRAGIWSKFVGNLHVHRWHPTYSLVHQMLYEIGYREITRYSFRKSNLDNIHLLETREFMTFYIEAIK